MLHPNLGSSIDGPSTALLYKLLRLKTHFDGPNELYNIVIGENNMCLKH